MRSTSQYVLGDSDAEHDRLTRQAAVLAPFTLRLFQDAGLRKGHRVLDIGCGMGDVTMLAAEVVGVEGVVVGIDSDSSCIEKARKRSSESSLSNIEFIETDIDPHFWTRSSGIYLREQIQAKVFHQTG